MTKKYAGRRIMQIIPDNTGAVAVYHDDNDDGPLKLRVIAWGLVEEQCHDGEFITYAEAMVEDCRGTLELCSNYMNFTRLEFPE